jgi:hypothetical protein
VPKPIVSIFKPTFYLLTLLCYLNGLSSISSPRTVFAQVVQETVTVTASVPDNAGPSTPILISPTNNSYVTDSTPEFIWEASTDANGIGKYVLTLDGTTLFDNIPTTPTDNSQYTLTYNNVLGRYTLTPKAIINDGAHTWKVRAEDTLSNGTDSATWNFTMDTQSPTFVLNTLGELNVSISAQDAGTIPATPLVLQDNEPLLAATGEANSTVSVTLVIPGDPTQNFNTTINSGGNWSLQLGILPRDVVMTLSFTITDPAGNVSVLSGLEFIIESDVIVFPPASPSVSPTPSLEPSASPASSPDATPEPTPSPTITPDNSPFPSPSPLISIPVVPPREIAFELTQELIERIPEPIKVIIENLPEEVLKTIEEAAPVSGLLVSAALPAASAVAVGSQFGGGISLNIIIKILQALGLLPSGKPQGMVFNSKTYEPVPFALLTITNPNTKQIPVVETVVTDVLGVYRGVKLPPDMYQIIVSHQDFRFPTSQPRPQYLQMTDFYRGELFGVQSNETEQLFLIPVDPINETGKSSLKTKLRIYLAQFGKLSGVLLLPLFIVSGFLALLFPSIWNWLIFGVYCILVSTKAAAWFRVPRVTGTVIDEQGLPIENAVVRLSISETNQLAAVISTGKDGNFRIHGPKEKYQLVVTKPGFIWKNNQSALSFYEVNATQSSQHVVVTMTPMAQVYANLF